MAVQQLDPLWKEYVKKKNPEIKEKLVIKYISLVKYVAGRLMITLPPSVEIDDLESAGVMGLIDAIERFDPKYGVKFESYAIPRIKGSMLDELRKLDWIPRSIRSKTRELEKVIQQVENEKGRPATDEELSEKLNMSMDEYYDLLKEVGTTSLLSLDEILYDNDGGKADLHEVIEDPAAKDAMEGINRDELKDMMIKAIDDLPEIERLVIALYYYEELTLKEIGQVLQLSESRISQIHTKTILSLRAKLKEAIKT
ncbi:RNA polymerase sigma factor WhiG [candidate division KSB1 bacterium]|nr:MAG: RNA polymerase sigma factor WhiG [candidate division KSB1 bacterium]